MQAYLANHAPSYHTCSAIPVICLQPIGPRISLITNYNNQGELGIKGATGEETVRAIRSVSGGEAIFSPSVAKRLIQYFSAPPVEQAPLFPGLTEREREVLRLIAQGYTNSAIAEQLTLSPKAVRNHVSNIFGKLQVAGRAEAIIRARDAGMGG